MTTTASPAADTGFSDARLAQMRNADDELSRARWLAYAFDMALSHPDALSCAEDFPIRELAKTTIARFISASRKAEDALASAIEALEQEAAS